MWRNVCRNFVRVLSKPRNGAFCQHISTVLKIPGSILLANNSIKMENFDLNLQQACDLGETEIIIIMDSLNREILSICNSYKDCLRKQIEILKEILDTDLLSNRWDDLPEFRIKAQQLNQELNDIIIVINTIGQMAENKSMKYITDEKEQIRLISSKFEEIRVGLRKQTVEINTLEAILLALKRKIILKKA